jgi:anaerobic selenocysteine-containing dehydrogenase
MTSQLGSAAREQGTHARVDRIADLWGTRTPYARGGTWPPRQDQFLAEGVTPDDVDRWVQTASVLHSNGDALDIAVAGGRIVGVRGRSGDRVNRGRVDPKDLFGWQANHASDRLTTPLVRRAGRLEPAGWDEAMDLVVQKLHQLLAERGPSSIGFYTSGQLFLEEYYTLGVIAHAGIATKHLDGNTRLCTATAGEALKESFGSDGQPGSYEDVDHADALALFGHNVAETQTVLWTRMLDRLAGPDRPALLCVDPRLTPVAREATVHLAPLPGTNLALMNGLLHEILAHGWVDEEYIAAHTVGFEGLAALVEEWTPERTADVCGIRPRDVQAGAELLGTAPRLLSTVLQGFYQSHQATAAAVQVNNIHLVRGMLGRPGCGVLQMNGQPTAQNTRETGANGDMAGFRNWSNPDHIAQLGRLWNVDPEKIPHDGPPTHAMKIFKLAEQGDIGFLWVQATNPAVSLPELSRIRKILASQGLFLVVQDLFLTETAQLADVVLPAAGWAEKTGTFTNADRTVHLSEQAIDPPGEARSDFDIFVDLARRLDLRDKDGGPLVTWSTPQEAFEAWKECSRGRPCDYSALTYDALRGPSGIQWPVTADAPAGTGRLYTDGVFPTAADECETYGKDLLTGEPVKGPDYKAHDPAGRAIIRSAAYVPPHEPPSAQYPFALVTGRTVYHFHTRTKTGRAPQLQDAAPDVWIEVSPDDAAAAGLSEGDEAQVTTARGFVRGRVRVSGVRPGVLFIPFHYGYWDEPADHEHDRAANELTPTDWDAASKQPLFKTAAASLTRIGPSTGPAPAPTTAASAPVGTLATTVPGTAGGASALVEEVSLSG